MNKPSTLSLYAAVLLLFAHSLGAGEPFAAPTWTREAALTAADSHDVQASLRPLFDLAREGRSGELLSALQALEQRADLAPPAREKVLYTFASGLGDLDARPDAQVFDYLRAYEARTLIPHDHHAAVGIPLYNIGAAAEGALAGHQRLEGRADAMALATGDPREWVDAYLTANRPARQGFRQAIGEIDRKTTAEIAELALDRGITEPELIMVSLSGAVALTDPNLFQRALGAATGPGLAGELRLARERFDAEQLVGILQFAMRQARPSTAALAMATLAPGMVSRPEVARLLIEALEGPTLGPAAALLLAASDDPWIKQQLTAMTEDGKSPAARRLEIAVNAGQNLQRGGRK